MWDMLTPMSQAQPGNIVTLKMATRGCGYILSQGMLLYFVRIDDSKRKVIAALDVALQDTVKLDLRAIKTITTIDGTIIYSADPRDMVYGIR